MKVPYEQPAIQVIIMLPRDGVLVTGSSEGYTIDDFNPGLSSATMNPFSGDELSF